MKFKDAAKRVIELVGEQYVSLEHEFVRGAGEPEGSHKWIICWFAWDSKCKHLYSTTLEGAIRQLEERVAEHNRLVGEAALENDGDRARHDISVGERDARGQYRKEQS